MSVRIFTSHHKQSTSIDCDCIESIQVGAVSNCLEVCFLKDSDGADNMSHKNAYYCELTAQYYVWKNIHMNDDDYVGFMHYRRHLCFDESNILSEDQFGNVNFDKIDSQYISKNKLNTKDIEKSVCGYDVITAKKWDIRGGGFKSIYQHYAVEPTHIISDYDIAIDILLKKYPEYKKVVHEYNIGHYGYFTNVYIFKYKIFCEYCSWLFGILEELEGKISIGKYDVQQKRVFGFIAERLFGIWITHNTKLKIKELQRTFVHSVEEYPRIEPAFEESQVTVVTSADDSFFIPVSVTIQSIILHSSKDINYDIVVLSNNIKLENILKIKSLSKDMRNISIRFIDISNIDKIKTSFSHMHFSQAMYGRLLIPTIFEKFNKVIYIDSDTVVCENISILDSTDFEGKSLAVIKDLPMSIFCREKTMCPANIGMYSADKYLKEYLKISDSHQYFQSGVILFNIEKIINKGKHIEMINSITSRKYWFPDQDVLNKIFQNDVKYIDTRWNTLHGNGDESTFIPLSSFREYSEYTISCNNPFIIHYAGEKKPWKTIFIQFWEQWWEVCRTLPWYEGALFWTVHQNMYIPTQEKHVKKDLFYNRKVFHTIYKKMPKVIQIFLSEVKYKILIPIFNK